MTDTTNTTILAEPPRFKLAAMQYAALGIRVFPVHYIVTNKETGALECSCLRWKRKNAQELYGEEVPACPNAGKHGRVDSWISRATSDGGQIDRWAKKFPVANIGVVTGEASGILVLDIDGAEGQESLDALIKEHGELPPTVTARTGSGGFHYYFKHGGVKVPNSASTIAPKIDFRGDGGFVVAPPSNHKSGGMYKFLDGRALGDVPFADLPAWLMKLATEKPGRKSKASVGSAHDKKGSRHSSNEGDPHQGFEQYLSALGDGDGRLGFDSPIYKACCSYFGTHGAEADAVALKDKLVGAITAAPEDPTRPRKDSKYLTDEYLDRRIREAQAYIAETQPAGNDCIFTDETELVETINQTFALVTVGSKVVYLRQRGVDFDLFQKQACSDLLKPWKVRSGQTFLPGFATWLESPHRRVYDGLVFDPNGSQAGLFNLWKGLALKPIKGDWSKFRVRDSYHRRQRGFQDAHIVSAVLPRDDATQLVSGDQSPVCVVEDDARLAPSR